jgi:membrane-associated phospholipid phosphatase
MKKLLSSIFFWGIILFWLVGLIIVLNSNQMEFHKKLNGFNNHFLDAFVPYATHIGDGVFAILLVVIFYFINKKNALILLLSFLISSGITQVLKQVVYPNIMRPMHYFQNDDSFHVVKGVVIHFQNSFPSGHATTCFALFTTFALFWWENQKLQVAFLIAAILFALTRVYLSQHFFEDVLAGSFVGTVTAFIMGVYFPKLHFVEKLEQSK